MGNHSAGRAMCTGASAVIDASGGIDKMTQAQALKSLDDICEPWRVCDAEFDGEEYLDKPLGALITKAFSQKTDWLEKLEDAESLDASESKTDDFWDCWYEECRIPFKERYNFW